MLAETNKDMKGKNETVSINAKAPTKTKYFFDFM